MNRGSMFRHSLTRVLYEQMLYDEALRNFNTSKWYACNLESIHPEELRNTFLQLSMDQETTYFVDNCFTKSKWVFIQMYHAIAKLVLSPFMTQTSINGWLNRGSMFVFSQQQFLSLLQVPEDWKAETLLDLGAGDGKVTRVMAPFFNNIYVTEVSSVMVSKLTQKNYKVLDPDQWINEREHFDIISALNLLDRCTAPLSLLAKLKSKLTPGSGRLLLALVIPCNQYVESGGRSHEPEEHLKITGETFEAQVNSFVEDVLIPMGFEVEQWSRVPYLCEGDLVQSYFWLDDALFVLKVAV